MKDLKARLSALGLDFSACVEKVELQALWQQHQDWLAMPLEKLQAHCAAAGGPRWGSAAASARFLMVAKPASSSTSGASRAFEATDTAQPLAAALSPQAPQMLECASSAEAAQREREANDEVCRILPLRREAFHSLAAWGFAVLAMQSTSQRDQASVQRSYRGLMRRLHPDKVTQTPKVVKAVEIIREAKDACERSLLRLDPPGAPRSLRSVPIDATSAGRRRFKLYWAPPANVETAPVRRYIVAALDPAYGKPLTITILEPEYSQELGRFVSLEELASFTLAEEELQKMPSLWQQKRATIQVAAANEAGQSSWATLEVHLSAVQSFTVSTTASDASESDASDVFEASSCDSPSVYSCSDFSPPQERSERFETEMKRRSGAELRAWLRTQAKAQLVAWMRRRGRESSGTKQELMDRILRLLTSSKKSTKDPPWAF